MCILSGIVSQPAKGFSREKINPAYTKAAVNALILCATQLEGLLSFLGTFFMFVLRLL